MLVRTKSIGNKKPLFADFSIPFPPGLGDDGDEGDFRLRDLIEIVVRNEVQAFLNRQTDRQFVRALTTVEIETAEQKGKIAMGASDVPRQMVDAGHAVAIALEAFEDGLLNLLPVHAQHRGRLFLPFADNDPKTAEIVSKVLLLARDEEIMDPLILEQLGAESQPSPKQVVRAKTKKKAVKKTTPDTGKLKRRLEYTDGKSNKFWKIERAGETVTTTWGRIGSNGQSKTKTFASEEKAQRAFFKMIKEKTEKGYQEPG